MENTKLTPDILGQYIAKIADEYPEDLLLALKESDIDATGKDPVAELFKHIATNSKLQEEVAGMIHIRNTSKFSNFTWADVQTEIGSIFTSIKTIFSGTDAAAVADASAAAAKAKARGKIFMYVGIGVGVVALIVTAIIIIKKSGK
jgi:hypothetical protein